MNPNTSPKSLWGRFLVNFVAERLSLLLSSSGIRSFFFQSLISCQELPVK
jgi:hypothetical protein